MFNNACKQDEERNLCCETFPGKTFHENFSAFPTDDYGFIGLLGTGPLVIHNWPDYCQQVIGSGGFHFECSRRPNSIISPPLPRQFWKAGKSWISTKSKRQNFGNGSFPSAVPRFPCRFATRDRRINFRQFISGNLRCSVKLNSHYQQTDCN